MIKILNLRFSTIPGSICKAFVDINFNGMLIYGLRIIDGRNGLFVSYPREKGKDDKYYDICRPEDVVLKNELETLVLTQYKTMLKNKLSEQVDD